MDIRTFEAFSMKDAIKSVKKALGADAVILSTKEKPSENGKNRIIEVTAAAAGTMRSVGGAQAQPGVSLQQSGMRELEGQLDGLSIRMSALQDSTPTKRQVETIEAGLREVKMLLVEALRGKEGSTLKDLPIALVPLERQLRVMGVDDASMTDLVRHLRTLPDPTEEAEGFYRDHAVRWMMKRIKIASRWQMTPGAPAVHALVGPPGAGKTAAVAKIAARYHMKEKAKVAVASCDHHRLAASEQMRVFCKVVGVPFIALSDETDLRRAVDQKKDVDLLLIDTPGIGAKSASGMAEIQALKNVGVPIEFHLCLSVTEKESQLDAAIKAYAPLGLSSLVFTKLDESWSFGEIYNLSRRWSLPLSFFSVGPEIPQDVERATRERVLERLFGL